MVRSLPKYPRPKVSFLKIVHTESSLGWGGQEIRILGESEKLRAMGHDVIILCDRSSTIIRNLPEWAPTVKGLGIRLRKKGLNDLTQLRAALKSLSPDIVICHSSTDHWLSAVARLSLTKKFPIVRTRHISTSIRENLLTKWLYRRGCEYVITTGSGIRESLVRSQLCSPKKVSSIPTGLEATRFQRLSRDQARELTGMTGAGLKIGIIATLRSWKGHEDLIHAFSLLDFPSLELIIVGSGPRQKALLALSASLGLSSRIKFVGQQPDVTPWFAALDVYVHPSYANEGVPQAILQAMATGLPIVSCPIGGIPEAVENYRAVKFAPIRSPNELAEAIRAALSELPSNPSRAQLHHVPFTELEMALQCEQVYRSSIDKFQAI